MAYTTLKNKMFTVFINILHIGSFEFVGACI